MCWLSPEVLPWMGTPRVRPELPEETTLLGPFFCSVSVRVLSSERVSFVSLLLICVGA